MKYSYRDGQGQAGVFHDSKGQALISLLDVARFYGIRVSFTPLTGRVTLVKGERQVHFALNQPFFLLGETRDTFPMDPVVLISGQVGITSDSMQMILRFILNLNVQYMPQDRLIVAGGVKQEEVRNEILASFNIPAAISAPVSDRLRLVPAVTREPVKRVERVKIQPPSGDQIYRVRKIVLDAGHGGHDGGAKSYSKHYLEKDLTLDVAKRVAEILADEPGFEVFLTRKTDVYLSLKDRTDFANKNNADLFVSIHANANPNRRASGTETYVYSSHASDKVASVAAFRENDDVNLMDFIQNDLLHSAFRARSFLLAEKVDQRVRDRLGQKIRRIEQAPFYVLARVNMPSVLIETAFISNQAEEKKLRNPEWRDKMARSIADGILSYRDQVEDSLDAHRAQKP